ncbi:anti-sigma factor [Methylobrevis pamukkalensis]|uniref:Anti-sigma-K factor rskA n=1 Tax=Methylobrevis pamukkalensis TaxID=1439726 RepID=A0A1E3GYN0_9HYPH|nr:Anti-sigma-K factor rskA [Methylobrevis pamukkalensis]
MDERRVRRLERSVRFWRRATTGMAVIAASLAGLVYLASLPTPPTAGTRFVSVVNGDGSLPALVIEVDTLAGDITVRPVQAEAPAGRSLELWYVPEGGSPRSLGLVDRAQPIAVSAAAIGRNPSAGGFAVSVEPPGGSPEGRPTGPVIYSGKLISRDP